MNTKIKNFFKCADIVLKNNNIELKDKLVDITGSIDNYFYYYKIYELYKNTKSSRYSMKKQLQIFYMENSILIKQFIKKTIEKYPQKNIKSIETKEDKWDLEIKKQEMLYS